jgi:hypothetical protein
VLFDPCVPPPVKTEPGISIPAVEQGLRKRLTAPFIDSSFTRDSASSWRFTIASSLQNSITIHTPGGRLFFRF